MVEGGTVQDRCVRVAQRGDVGGDKRRAGDVKQIVVMVM